MHLFSKENIWSNPQQFPASCIHPDKHNNSVNRIISKEEEREDPRRDSSIYLRVQWCFHIPTRFLRIQCILQCFYTQSSKFPVIPCHSTYRINSSTRILQEILQLQGSSRAGSFQQLFPVSPSILHGRIRLPDLPTAFQAP